MKLKFIYNGVPRGQERPRFGGRVAYKTDEARQYEAGIAMAYRMSSRGARALEEPLAVDVLAGYPIPASATKAQRAAMLAGELLPTKKPDIDNVVKAILDALNGIAWADDRQVVCVSARKVYANTPGLIITIKTGEDMIA